LGTARCAAGAKGGSVRRGDGVGVIVAIEWFTVR
jgi:hypothetical protein